MAVAAPLCQGVFTATERRGYKAPMDFNLLPNANENASPTLRMRSRICDALVLIQRASEEDGRFGICLARVGFACPFGKGED